MLSVLAESSQLAVDDTGYLLVGEDGQPIDDAPTASARPAASADASVPARPFAECVCDQWRRLLDRAPAASTHDPAATDAALACAQACLLSARTGEPENPGKLLKIAGR